MNTLPSNSQRNGSIKCKDTGGKQSKTRQNKTKHVFWSQTDTLELLLVAEFLDP